MTLKAIALAPDVYWVGVKDWTLREFHGYRTDRGSTYNAYLILDEKKTLIDAAKATYASELLGRIRSLADPAALDVIVCNHVEMDHSGALPELVKLAPNATIYCTAAGEKGLKKHYGAQDWKFQLVKAGDTLKIGRRTLKFLPEPMVHWPDSMMTYAVEDKILFPNDAFGQHYCSPHLFDDETPLDLMMDEARKYFANIVWPYCGQVAKALKDAAGLPELAMIAPSHGCVWRSHIPAILERYAAWSSYQHDPKLATVVYDTMWGPTAQLARIVENALMERGVKVHVHNLKVSDSSDAVRDMLESQYVFIGSATLNSGMLPTVGAFLTYIKGLQPKGKTGFAFGSYGWKRGAGLDEVEAVMKNLGWTLPEPAFPVNYAPEEADFEALRQAVLRIVPEE